MKKRFLFHHPLDEAKTLTLELEEDTLLREVSTRLYQEGFIQPKTGGYQYLIDGRLCSQGRTLACYLPPDGAGTTDVYVRNLLIL